MAKVDMFTVDKKIVIHIPYILDDRKYKRIITIDAWHVSSEIDKLVDEDAPGTEKASKKETPT